MARLGRWIVLALPAIAVVVPATPASAVPPDCDVRTYGGGDELVIRTDKSVDVRLDCGWEASDHVVAARSGPSHGTLGPATWDADLHEWVVSYTPAPGYTGPDAVTFSVTDGEQSADVVASIRIEPNRAPSCDRRLDPVYDHVLPEQSWSLTLACGDFDFQDYGTLQGVVGSEPGHGTVDVDTEIDSQTYEEMLTVTYTPDPGFEGSDHFTAGMTDGDLTDLHDFFLNVSDGPWCHPSEPVQVRAGKTVRVRPYCTSPGWEQLTTSVPTPPEHGSTSFVGMAIDYTADADASGPDSFTFQATGVDGTSNVVTQEVTILPNAAPLCEDRDVTTPRDEPVEVTLVCSDPDGDDHELAVADKPDHGTLGELADGTVTYTPDPGWDGTDSFTYTASDFARTSTPATVVLSVTEEEAPVVDVRVPEQTPTRVARRGMRLRLSTDEPVIADLALVISPRLARRLDIPRRIGRKHGLTVEEGRRVRVPLTRAAARALRTRQRLTVFVDLVAQDEWGNGAGVETRAVLR